MRKSIISTILVLCMLFSTASVFATIPDTINTFAINGVNYTFVEVENAEVRDVRVYDVDGGLVEHMQYNKESDSVYDVLRNEFYEVRFAMNLLNNAIGDTDSEGYRFMGNYIVDLDQVESAVSAMTILITYGVSISTAQSIVGALTLYVKYYLIENYIYDEIEDIPEEALDEFFETINATIEVRGELWMKTDNTYDYSKKIENFYFVSDLDEDAFLFGPVTTRQKKRNDMKMMG